MAAPNRSRRWKSIWPPRPHRLLLVAESEGRRESLLEMLRDHKISVPSVASLDEFEASDEKVAITAAPLASAFFWHEPADGITIQFLTETELLRQRPHARAGATASKSRPATSRR
ncbi:MAG: hypothetical protein IPJ08_14780 [Burkholderiales bacterium]|nr:hypothetical protein [Burkholderiales bacterium]